jgi:hypothetical protein|tara:strand:- start:499 stop:1131 length:633 start_codon:yes stop_codon:yes gene_type:complete
MIVKYLKNLLSIKKFNYSQAGQDLFAYELFGKNGTYIDIGSGMPKLYSNTYLLEVDYGWKGFGIEYNLERKKDWSSCPERKNRIYWTDALNFNYQKALKENKITANIDFLSCDIEPQENTFLALKKVINENIKPKLITFEHDRYKEKKDYDILAREFLLPKGYKIGIENVYSGFKKNKIFETWFVREDINFASREYKNWVEKKEKFFNFL